MVEGRDADFVGCLAGNLRAATRLVTQRYDTALRDQGLRITQVAILAHVDRHGPVSVTRLAGGLATERSAVARETAVLERDGLVEIGVDPGDRRARAITLTTAGRDRLRAAAPAWRRSQRELRELLGPELAERLLDTSRRVVVALDAA